MPLLNKLRQETLEEIKSSTARQIATDVAHLNDFLIARYNAVMKMFWKNNKLSPQQVSDSLGTEASELFILGGKLASLIVDINPDSASSLEVPLYPFTFNQNGTVTINVPIQEEPTEETPIVNPTVIP